MQSTLVLLKPDVIDRGIIGEIIQRFERVGLKIVGLKLVRATQELAEQHYTQEVADRRGEDVRKRAIQMITDGPIVAICLEGIEAVELVRKMVGPTEPKSAPPGTIRGDYAHISFKHADSKQVAILNLVHASGNAEEAQQETKVWFRDDELVMHNPGYTAKTLGE